jgi:hypothetical protein
MSVQKRLNHHHKRMRDEDKMRNSALIDMVQWRFEMEILDEQQSMCRI